jgi:predicted N-acyltransferase
LNTNYTYLLFTHSQQLPTEWGALAQDNIFLSQNYLEALEIAAPANMKCQYIGVFDEDQLIGIALAQFIDLSHLETYGERDKKLKTWVRNYLFSRFSSKLLFIGNNMLSGQNAFIIKNGTNVSEILKTLKNATAELNQNSDIHLTSFKDFMPEDLIHFDQSAFIKDLKFSSQPNMIFDINPTWNHEDDYVKALTKKYRDQYKRSRNKALGIQKRKLSLEEIQEKQEIIYDLYLHVAENAPFNTFYLPKNHFFVLKEKLKDDFMLYGYFIDGKLIGFNTLIKNGKSLDTYFLGYDEKIQKEKMLYLNMLYDMIACGIRLKFKNIIFGRTALEIKSSVGAIDTPMFGFMRHSQPIINQFLGIIFNYLEPATIWKRRSPFKNKD